MKRVALAVLLAGVSTGGCMLFDADRRREVWQREKEAVRDLGNLFDHFFLEPK